MKHVLFSLSLLFAYLIVFGFKNTPEPCKKTYFWTIQHTSEKILNLYQYTVIQKNAILMHNPARSTNRKLCLETRKDNLENSSDTAFRCYGHCVNIVVQESRKTESHRRKPPYAAITMQEFTKRIAKGCKEMLDLKHFVVVKSWRCLSAQPSRQD